jgi:hypothetical protein
MKGCSQIRKWLHRRGRSVGTFLGTNARNQTGSDAKAPVVFLKKNGQIEPDATTRRRVVRTPKPGVAGSSPAGPVTTNGRAISAAFVVQAPAGSCSNRRLVRCAHSPPLDESSAAGPFCRRSFILSADSVFEREQLRARAGVSTRTDPRPHQSSVADTTDG